MNNVVTVDEHGVVGEEEEEQEEEEEEEEEEQQKQDLFIKTALAPQTTRTQLRTHDTVTQHANTKHDFRVWG